MFMVRRPPVSTPTATLFPSPTLFRAPRADLWSGAPPASLAGCLWRLYVLRSWVYADPELAARQFEAGRGNAEVARVVAGVADPPGPDQVRAMIDAVLRGVADGDFADVLLRAAAFSRVGAVGRAHLGAVDAKEERVLSRATERRVGEEVVRSG